MRKDRLFYCDLCGTVQYCPANLEKIQCCVECDDGFRACVEEFVAYCPVCQEDCYMKLL